ncbi:MAG: hypothetical protein Q7R49_00580 [Candidatus Daviesbacteria bacterium]|nr:hypothetical protein [Candidatus Daviesbacteria bacterium]
MKLIQYQKNYREDSIDIKVDKDRAIFPFLSNSGYANITSNGLFTSILIIPSGKRFIMEGFMLNNSAAVGNFGVFYDGQSGSQGLVTLPPYQIAASQTDIQTRLKIPFQSGVYISAGPTALTVRVWGYLIASGVI